MSLSSIVVPFHHRQYLQSPGKNRSSEALSSVGVFFVDDMAYRKAAIQEMERALLPVAPVRPTTDKRSRLQTVAPLIKKGTVLFQRAGC